jgi:outer membrane murein-binding lipoprotein Lpp
MMTGVIHDQAQPDGELARAHRPSIWAQFDRLQEHLQLLGELIMAFQDELDRLRSDVTNYAQSMRDKVSSLQSQITQLQGQVSTATTDQMTADAQALSDQLDQLEQALAQDSQPAGGSGGTTPSDPGTGTSTDTPAGTDPNAPAGRRHH